MHDFKYCIWLVPNKHHSWINIPNDFTPHMTVKSHLDQKEANYIYNKIKKENYQIKVKLVGKLCQDNTEDFYALQYMFYLYQTIYQTGFLKMHTYHSLTNINYLQKIKYRN